MKEISNAGTVFRRYGRMIVLLMGWPLFFAGTVKTVNTGTPGHVEPVPPDSFPVPAGNPNQLFYLQRTPNVNTIVYELNYKEGSIDEKEPVHVFWIRYGEKGQRAELSYIQEHFAYGIRAKQVAKDRFELRFASYKKYSVFLLRDAGGQYHVYASINQKIAMLSRIFISIHGGSFWSPNIEYVELKGIDPATGNEVVERMKV
ncbi:MAG TPA: DUF4833 domain-containing protein [Chitinophagaceae bacterium]|nr:DUF4833 domain-containing protein [Chitinophagaceae bacterium]